jgi:hypothetical protein
MLWTLPLRTPHALSSSPTTSSHSFQDAAKAAAKPEPPKKSVSTPAMKTATPVAPATAQPPRTGQPAAAPSTPTKPAPAPAKVASPSPAPSHVSSQAATAPTSAMQSPPSLPVTPTRSTSTPKMSLSDSPKTMASPPGMQPHSQQTNVVPRESGERKQRFQVCHARMRFTTLTQPQQPKSNVPMVEQKVSASMARCMPPLRLCVQVSGTASSPSLMRCSGAVMWWCCQAHNRQPYPDTLHMHTHMHIMFMLQTGQ